MVWNGTALAPVFMYKITGSILIEEESGVSDYLCFHLSTWRWLKEILVYKAVSPNEVRRS